VDENVNEDGREDEAAGPDGHVFENEDENEDGKGSGID
jgi:hypothetical protein